MLCSAWCRSQLVVAVKIAQIDRVGDMVKFWGYQSLPVSSGLRIGGFKKKSKDNQAAWKNKQCKVLSALSRCFDGIEALFFIV